MNPMNARDQIIATTCTLIELQGYHATGLNQIVRESGSPKGSLYYYFPGGKEELTEEALRSVGKAVHERIKVNLAANADAASAVQKFIALIADQVETSGFRAGGPITTVAMETASTSERLRAVCHEIYSGWIALFEAKFREAQISAGRAAALANLTIAAIEGGIILSRTAQNADALRHVAQQLAALIKFDG
ncbi:MAG: transcriptional regulator LmrA [Anaerolineae bacterium]